MEAISIELPAFERYRAEYKDQASDLTKEQRQTLRHALERIKGER